ncbi:MAG: helix-turn-helix domain-containing protein [Muribaculaceae bacterium]|nr:helix-turn-helix domain-containing protein [Muribaculaceae bacterium]
MTHANNPQHDTQLHAMLLYLIEKVEALSSPLEYANRIYDNKALMALLGVKDRYLKRLRDNGLLGYSRHGDKYWYTQVDVDNFLASCHFAPFLSNF